jgi:nucleoside-diphosphate-sugar epimerase
LSNIDVYRAIAVSQGAESGPLQEVPLTEESELRRSLHPYPPESIQLMRKIFPWVTEDYDKIPAERTVMNDRELPGTVLRLPMVYGPGDRLHRFCPVVKRIADGRDHTIFAEALAARTPRHLLKPGNAAQHWTASSVCIRHELGYQEPVASTLGGWCA